MADLKKAEKPPDAAFDDFFESLGKKAEQLTLNDKAVKRTEYGATVNGKESTTETTSATDDANEQEVVDEIESLCMNCRENVSHLGNLFDRGTLLIQC
jgi:zinc finger protein